MEFFDHLKIQMGDSMIQINQQSNTTWLFKSNCHFFFTCLVIAIILVMTSGCGQTVPVATDKFDIFRIGTSPHLSGVLNLMTQADEPFVAMNALIFKDQATGEKYEGLTGEEAYMIYINGSADIHTEMDSRVIWSGRVQNQIIGESDPTFEMFGLLEYASPKNLLQLMTDPGDSSDARSAGLYGQWNISTKTVAESGLTAISVPQENLPDVAELVLSTGMTEEQITLLLESSADEPVFVVEMLRFSDKCGVLYAPYSDALAEVYETYGAALIWRGEFNYFFIGTAFPKFHQMVITMFPNPAAYLLMLSDSHVTAALDSKENGLAIHWAYTAVEEENGI